MDRNSDIMVDIPIDDTAKAYDDAFEIDGTPKDLAPAKTRTPRDDTASPKTAKEKTDTRDDELATLRRERDHAAQTAQQIASEYAATIAAERKARQEAEAEVSKRTDQTMRARWGQVTAEDDHVGGMLTSHKREQLEVKAQLKAALDTGDTEKQSELLDTQSKLNAAIFELEKAKRNTAAEVEKTRDLFASIQKQNAEKPTPKEDPEVKPAVEAKRQPTPDEWIGQFPRKTANWLRENKDYVTDPDKHKELMAFAQEWAADYGQSTLHTPQFIEAMNAKFSSKPDEDDQPEQETVVDVETAPKQRAAPAHSAPVSRASAPTKSSSQTGTKVRLTPDQQSTALSIFPEAKTPAEAYVMYAQGLQKATSEGRFLPRE